MVVEPTVYFMEQRHDSSRARQASAVTGKAAAPVALPNRFVRDPMLMELPCCWLQRPKGHRDL